MGSLTISLSNAVSFTGGYRVRYRKVGEVAYTYATASLTGTSLVITGVDQTAQYEGMVEGVCVTNGITTYTSSQSFITA
jgi:hypothetical protein